MRIISRKQVGILYHFVGSTANSTAVNNLKAILFSGKLKAVRDYVSFTRSFELPKTNELNFGGRVIRIAIDGDKLSDKYKVEPFIDAPFNKRDRNSESESIVKLKEVDIKNCIIQVDILDTGKFSKSDFKPSRFFNDRPAVIQKIILKRTTQESYDKEVAEQNKTYEVINFVKKWRPVK